MQSSDPLITSLQEWIEVFMRRSMRNFLQYTRESGLSMSQIGALFHIHRHGSSAVSDLGDHLGVTNAAVSQMLERMVQQKLIERSEDPNDRRVKKIVLTDLGRKTLMESVHARQAWLIDLADSMSASEQEQVQAALTLLVEKARRPQETE